MTSHEIILSDAQTSTFETIKVIYDQLSDVTKTETNPRQLPDVPFIVITGLSGIGKSTLVNEIKRMFPLSESSGNGEITILLINTYPFIIVQDSLTSSSFNHDGIVKPIELSSAELLGLSEPNKQLVSQKYRSSDILRVTQRTLNRTEANQLISGVGISQEISAEVYNQLTLGIPKLILECAGKNESEVIEHVAWYLSKCMYQLQDINALRTMVQTLEGSFLSPDRSIPISVLQKIPEILSIWKSGGIYGSLLRRYQNSDFIFRALQTLHPETRAYYSSRELGWSTRFTLRAWIDTSDVNFEILESELNRDRPDFSRTELGLLGQLINLFKLHRSVVGFESRSAIAGGATKSKFGFELSNGVKSFSIGNTMGRSLFPETSLEANQSSPFARAFAQMHADPPNFIIEVYDHDVIAPAQAMGGLEAVLQSLGIHFEVTHPDDKVFEYMPSGSTYERIIPHDELLRQRRHEHHQQTSKKKRK